MAVHVIPYNPWREQLALTALGNVAGDIIGDLWKSHRQNEQNRKANAFRGQLRQNLQNNSTQQDISLIPKEAPNGYNANPWAAAFHQDNSPLTQFDFGTSSVGKTPTLQDIANTADNLAATKRFSMLDTKTVNDIRDNFMQQSIGDMFANAGDIQGQMNTLTRGAAQGLVAPQVLTAFSPYAMKILSPYTFHESHLGKNNVISALNEITGEANPALIMPVSVSPDTEANNQASRDVANINAGATQHSADRNAEASMFSADRNFDAHVFSGNSTVQAHQLDAWQKMYDALKADIQADYQSLDGVDEKIALAKLPEIKAKEQKLAELEQKLMGGSQGTGANTQNAATANQGNSNNVWFSMVGSPKGISIHPKGTFRYDRGDHLHKGIDIIVAKGTYIAPRPEMGDTFLVTESHKSDSYGNTIVIESNRKFNGKTVQFRYAHMQDGSLKLKKGQTIKAGDIIGKVGSTGRSSGAHLHFEVIVDGMHVDPQTFFQHYKPDATSMNTQTTQQQQKIGQTPDTSQDIKVMQDNNGNFITQSELDKMIDEGAKKGYGVVAVKRALREKGYRDIPEKRNFDPNLNWSPSYMGGGIPQGDASTSAPMPNDNIVQKFIPSTNPTVTALTDNVSGIIGDFFSGLDLTKGTDYIPDEYKIPKLRNTSVIGNRWSNPSGYNLQQILDWVNSHQHNENPYWGHFQPSISPQKLPIKGNPVSSGANPWSYFQERPQNSVSPFWNFTDWLDSSSLNGNDIVPQSVYFSDPFYYIKNKQRLDDLLLNSRR